MKQLSMLNTMSTSSSVLIDKRTDDLYEEAKRLFRDGFAIITVDAANIPEDMLGEVVELLDLFYPETCDEPMFDVAGLDHPVPMSALTVA